MQQTDPARKRKIRAGLAFAVLTAVIVGVVILSSPSRAKKNLETSGGSSTAASQTNSTGSTTSSATSTTTTTSNFKDGTYTATGEYFSPGGQESIKVTITLSNDIVTASSAVSGANDSTAASYQSNFINGYKQFVIGKKITSINISNVSGSSLTSQGFNDALQQIEQQAKV